MSSLRLIQIAQAAGETAKTCDQIKADPANKNTLAYILCNFDGTDPNKNLGSVVQFINKVLAIALDWAGILAVIMIMYGSFLYLTAHGDDSKAETAKKTIIWSIVGLLIIALARILVNVIGNELSNSFKQV